jgi:hypothetical protein
MLVGDKSYAALKDRARAKITKLHLREPLAELVLARSL